MDFIYSAIAHLMMLTSIIMMFVFMGIFILRTEDEIEKIMRILALSVGILIFFGAKSMDTSIVNIIMNSIDSTGGVIVGLINYIFPAILGTFLVVILLKSIQKDNTNRKIYLLILISTLVILIFTDIYLGSIISDDKKTDLSINISFMVGIILTLLFKVDLIKTLYSNISSTNTQIDKEDNTSSWKDDY